MCSVDFSDADLVDVTLAYAVGSDPCLVVVDAFLVSVNNFCSKEAKCFSVCWDVDGAFLEVLLKLDDA